MRLDELRKGLKQADKRNRVVSTMSLHGVTGFQFSRENSREKRKPYIRLVSAPLRNGMHVEDLLDALADYPDSLDVQVSGGWQIREVKQPVGGSLANPVVLILEGRD